MCKETNGFTLVELLVVIAILGMLVAVVMPAISDVIFRGRLTKSVSEMSTLYKFLRAKESESIYNYMIEIVPSYGTPSNPISNVWDNSTDYFAFFVTNRMVINVKPSFFSAQGMMQAESWHEFASSRGLYNAWCVVSDCDEPHYPETGPMLFSRNLGQGMSGFFNLNDPIDCLDTELPPNQVGGEPFRQRGFVYLTKGGAAFALFKDDMKTKNFTNMFKVVDLNNRVLTNRCIRPTP